jgi:DNA-binding CsgD family transcriptional regulator
MILNNISGGLLEAKKARLLIPFVFGFVTLLSAQSGIRGKIVFDTVKWAPVAYLSLIPDFTQTNTISYEYIIERTNISPEGHFTFQSKFLPEKEHLYRIHFSKTNDPPSSLIIGGSDHNHFFLFAKKNAKIIISSEAGKNLINHLTFQGYAPNAGLVEINKMRNILDTLDYFGGTLNQDFIRESIFHRLRDYADTCSHPLLSLYAIYQSNYESDYLIQPGYYRNYLKKWKSEDSAYFETFRNNFKDESLSNGALLGIVGLGFLILVPGILLIYKRKKGRKKNLSTLTIQERKIYIHLKHGKSNKEIAEECAVSISTVKSHVSSIYTKLGIRSRKEAMDFTE